MSHYCVFCFFCLFFDAFVFAEEEYVNKVLSQVSW